MIKTPVPDGELAKGKQHLILDLPSYFETNTQTADAYAGLAVTGLPDDYFATFSGNVKKVTAADVQKATAAFDPSKLVWVLVGDRAALAKDLKTLGLGDPAAYDPDGNPK
jgi:predicted Zn-dependent peptidase